jgi:steroid delta-isomerase
MSNKERCLEYLRSYAQKDLTAIAAMFAEDIALRDWNVAVRGKAAAVAETARNFAGAQSIEIHPLNICENHESVAAELRIVVDGHIELHVVDVISFRADGRISSIHAYLGRADA